MLITLIIIIKATNTQLLHRFILVTLIIKVILTNKINFT